MPQTVFSPYYRAWLNEPRREVLPVPPSEVESRLAGIHGEGPEAFRRQLSWRDFYSQLLLHFPDNAKEEFRERYRGTIEWNGSEDAFIAWTEGRTGYPLVDAVMRQLRREGWMHNRARLVVGSFLTKYLGIDGRRGDRWFMRLLIEGDEANIGSYRPSPRPSPDYPRSTWQWIRSVGVDRREARRDALERYDA